MVRKETRQHARALTWNLHSASISTAYCLNPNWKYCKPQYHVLALSHLDVLLYVLRVRFNKLWEYFIHRKHRAFGSYDHLANCIYLLLLFFSPNFFNITKM